MLAPVKVGLVVAGVVGAGTAIAIPLTMAAEGQSSSSTVGASNSEQGSNSRAVAVSLPTSSSSSSSGTTVVDCSSGSAGNDQTISFGSPTQTNSVCWKTDSSTQVSDKNTINSLLSATWGPSSVWAKKSVQGVTGYCVQNGGSQSNTSVTLTKDGCSSSSGNENKTEYFLVGNDNKTFVKKTVVTDSSQIQVYLCVDQCWSGSSSFSKESSSQQLTEQTSNWKEMKFSKLTSTPTQRK